jgi:hypothetical protein
VRFDAPSRRTPNISTFFATESNRFQAISGQKMMNLCSSARRAEALRRRACLAEAPVLRSLGEEGLAKAGAHLWPETFNLQPSTRNVFVFASHRQLPHPCKRVPRRSGAKTGHPTISTIPFDEPET